jgi:HK97 family phage major capsid protein
MPSFDFAGIPTAIIQATAADLHGQVLAQLMDDDPAAWAKLSDDEQQRRIEAADTLSLQAKMWSDELAARLADGDVLPRAPHRAGQRQSLAPQPLTIDPDASRFMVGNFQGQPAMPGLEFRGQTPPQVYRYGEAAHIGRQPFEELGIGFTRYAKCLLAANGNPMVADIIAKQQYPEDGRIRFEAAMSQNVGTAGGFLVPEEQSREVAEYLRYITSVRPYARVIPINGTMTMPTVNAGITASYIGELQDDLAQDLQIGQRRFTARKLRALVAVSNDLIRNSSPEADRIVRDDLAGGLAEAEDLAFLRGNGLGENPKGLRNCATAANIATSSGTSAAQVESDLVALVALFVKNMRGKQQGARWFLPSRSYYSLYNLKRATTDLLVFPEIRDGNLLGFQVSVTDQLPVTLSPGTATDIMLVNMADVVIGEEYGINIAISDAASFKDSAGTLQSAFSLDLSCLRAIAKHDLVCRRDAAVAILQTVTW